VKKQPLGTSCGGEPINMYVVEGVDSGMAHREPLAKTGAKWGPGLGAQEKMPKRFTDVKPTVTGPRRKCQVQLAPNGGEPTITWEEGKKTDVWAKPKMKKQPLGTSCGGEPINMYVVEGVDSGMAHADPLAKTGAKWGPGLGAQEKMPKRFTDVKPTVTGPRRKCQVQLAPNGGEPTITWEEGKNTDVWAKPKMKRQPLGTSCAGEPINIYVVEGVDSGMAHGDFNIKSANTSFQ
jgi:hypothetical protein